MTTRRVLARAAVQLGGVPQLAKRLEVSSAKLRDYLMGVEGIPDALFLEAIDVVLEELPEPRRPARTRAPSFRGSTRGS